ncbi:MAG: porin family protein [Prevotellaceae bacterium]|nr:porin family protein [Prevotellaceae bacterium]
MKRILLVAALLVAFGTRQASAFGFDWGLTGGVNMTKIKIKHPGTNLSAENWAGWFIGPKVNLSLLAGLGADASLLYNQQQISSPEKLSNELWRSIEIPLNARYNIGIGRVASVYLATGPQFGFSISRHNWKGLDGFTSENMYTTWNIGAGAKVLGHLELGLGYNFGLSKFGKQTSTPSNSMKKNAFQLKATVYF